MIIKNEQNKKHIRTNHPGRSICIALLIVLVFSSASIYAASEVIIVSGTGSGVDQFADFNSNTTVANSYIVVDSTVPFSNAFNALSRNIAKLTSTAASSNLYINTTNSYIATLYTYLSNNLPGQWQTLSDIKTATVNNAVSTSALTTIISTDMWASLSYSPSYYDENFSQIQYSAYMNVGNDMYISTPDNTSIPANSILHIRLPISYMSNIQYLTIEFSNYRYGEITVPYYYVVSSMWQIDIYYIVPFNAVGSTYIHLHNDYGLRFTDTGLVGNALCEYIGPSNSRYKEYLNIMFNYQNHREIMNKLDNVNITASLDDDDIIDAINNLSLQDNDVKLNLTINNNIGSDGTTIIGRLQQFLNTGVSVGDFFDNVDDAESGWFSQSNSDVINTLSRGYTDFYE